MYKYSTAPTIILLLLLLSSSSSIQLSIYLRTNVYSHLNSNAMSLYFVVFLRCILCKVTMEIIALPVDLDDN